MDKDRKEIVRILSKMLDNPVSNWSCALLDQGHDPRTHEVPRIIEAARRDLQ